MHFPLRFRKLQVHNLYLTGSCFMTRFQSPLTDFPEYAAQENSVIASEADFLKNRREHYHLPIPGETPGQWPDLAGICLSGGGIRSATLSLGLVQRLISEKIMHRFDYLSSVSGGGFFSACFTSLMNQPSERFVTPPGHQPHEVPGLEPETSPFVQLMATTEKAVTTFEKARSLDATPPPEDTTLRLDARHQIHHLRSKGNYLTPDQSFFSRDIQRAIGTVAGGILHNMLLFATALTIFVSLHFVVFFLISDGMIFDDLVPPEMKDQGKVVMELTPQLTQSLIEAGQLLQARAADFWGKVNQSVGNHSEVFFAFFALGFLLAAYSIVYLKKVVWHIRMESGGIRHGKRKAQAYAGATVEDHHESVFMQRFNLGTILGGPALVGIAWPVLVATGYLQAADYPVVFVLPLAFAGGVLLAVFSLLPLLTRPNQPRTLRSLMGAMRGAALYACLISLLMPVYIVLLFSFSQLFTGIVQTLFSSVSSLASLVVAYVAFTSRAGDSAQSSWMKWIKPFKGLILNLAVVLAVLIGASATATGLAELTRYLSGGVEVAAWVLAISALLYAALGFFVNSNRISLHYFYRDRLVEAFLKTDGRVAKTREEKQGQPLVALRNDEGISLNEIGWRRLSGTDAETARGELSQFAKTGSGTKPPFRHDTATSQIWAPNHRMPYPIFVGSLNLQGSQELVRKLLKSEHFLFTPHYIGSQATGFVRSDVYRGGFTKLARAMAVSGAAVHSRMGAQSGFAQAMLATIFNFRLGYWMENPWFYRNDCRKKNLSHQGQVTLHRLMGWKVAKLADEPGWTATYDPRRRFTFWPFYLFTEIFGANTARQRLVNVSDGGHTGDNLGLLPLLRRRCKLIVVADFEQDQGFKFESFNHVVRMANIEENIRIRIDLSPLIPVPQPDGRLGDSASSAEEGVIEYPDGTTGKLIYIKSSLCPHPKPEAEVPKGFEAFPVNVFNYRQMHPDFPHQPTSDQYFDDAQFEAYRALGYHIGGFAAERL